MLCDLRIAELEKEREQHKVWVNKEEDMLLCRNSHICNMVKEGNQRTFAQAFRERYIVRDMAMLADHNNFMAFDINDEGDAQQRLKSFGRYVI